MSHPRPPVIVEGADVNTVRVTPNARAQAARLRRTTLPAPAALGGLFTLQPMDIPLRALPSA